MFFGVILPTRDKMAVNDAQCQLSFLQALKKSALLGNYLWLIKLLKLLVISKVEPNMTKTLNENYLGINTYYSKKKCKKRKKPVQPIIIGAHNLRL